jgi:hypothetical protein
MGPLRAPLQNQRRNRADWISELFQRHNAKRSRALPPFTLRGNLLERRSPYLHLALGIPVLFNITMLNGVVRSHRSHSEVIFWSAGLRTCI